MTETPGEVAGKGASVAVHTIDALMHGKEHNLSCYFLPGERPTLVEPGPESSLDNVVAELERLGVGAEDLAWIVVTHVHLDHGGGAGKLAARFPNATVVVHEQGARHLCSPDRLVASATRVYGEENMALLWGSMTPVPPERLRSVDEGDMIDLGGGRALEVMYTPGHAKHLMCLVDSDTGGVFVGDAVGITLPHSHLVRPTVPPPDIDPDLIVSQLERLQRRGVTSINFAHFGIDHDVDAMLDQAIRRVRRWDEITGTAVADGLDVAGVAQRLATHSHDDYVAEGYSPDVIAAAEERTNYEMEAAGLYRAHAVAQMRAASERNILRVRCPGEHGLRAIGDSDANRDAVDRDAHGRRHVPGWREPDRGRRRATISHHVERAR